MRTEIREFKGKKYRFVSLGDDFEIDDCHCCLFNNNCPSVIDCSDGFFIEEVKEKPPTKEDILKVIKMLKDPCGAFMDLVYSKEETAEIILKNWKYWNNEN